MNRFLFTHSSLRRQFLVSISSTLLVACFGYFLSDLIGYKEVALLLLVTVSLNAMFYDVKPVMTAAILSALVWNFFFIPPKFTLAINNAEDWLLFLMYFIVAMVNAVLTTKIRDMEKVARQKEEKENALKLYNTLLNSLSHELKTPIATIIAASDNLQTMSDKLTELNKHELVTEISKASLQLNRQVSNLLNMSRLESGFIRPKNDWFDAGELVYDVVKDLREEAQSKPIHVSIKENLPLFKLDYGLVWQILHNLVHNAITHIPKYSVITVKANCKGDKLQLVVEDTGNGFPEGETEKVFEKFYRMKDTKTGGTGLGLSIVKGFVEAMKGNVRLINGEESGAVFIVEIPSELSYVTSHSK